jgi:hypothetical protein
MGLMSEVSSVRALKFYLSSIFGIVVCLLTLLHRAYACSDHYVLCEPFVRKPRQNSIFGIRAGVTFCLKKKVNGTWIACAVYRFIAILGTLYSCEC